MTVVRGKGRGRGPCPACSIGTMRQNLGEKVTLGPYRCTCDRCGFESTQIIDARRDVVGRGPHAR